MAEKDIAAKPDRPLRKGWTTGACAAAAARAAYEALLTGRFPDPVMIVLPGGQHPEFALADRALGDGRATAGVRKDAGDDPDVTHGALVLATVKLGVPGAGIVFRAGEGVGTVTRAGLQLPPGEPAINARLGIVGGLSILGTTGVVIPYSCSSWIHSIHRGIDVARAAGLTHLAAATGSSSEAAVKAMYDLPDMALLDMGDFVGGTLKYLRRHPVPWLTIAGGFGKLAKLAAGHLDLHSGRSQVDAGQLAGIVEELGAPHDLVERARAARSAGEVLVLASAAKIDVAEAVARRARDVALSALGGTAIDVVVFDREGRKIAQAGP
jgi:cobalt-precorrin-5B (C1)-methyltransferase